MVTDANASVVSRHDYLPFGDEIPGGVAARNTQFGASDSISQRFTGKERDTETGLDFFGARYYALGIERFMSPDPKLVPSAIEIPQSWNKYGYSGNNPLRYVDPDGEDWKDIVAGGENAFLSDNLLGANRSTSGNSDFRVGQAIGDGAALVRGASQAIEGAVGTAIGTVLDSSFVGGLIGIPTQVVSIAVAAHGAGVAETAVQNLVTEASAIGPKEGETGGAGAGKRVTDSTKSAALQENKSANGGTAKCVFCGEPVGEGTGNKINYDHAEAKSKLGSNRLRNVNVTCEYCNKSKGVAKVRRNPKAPKNDAVPCGKGKGCGLGR